ncbi:TonB-dependent receptor [Sphingobium sp. SCG-1]|uniref:TonB-dependent receptor n=1 Tax=Sphingobium sp. SCG-1 TaxID=2072936 RepID=UPI000CD6B9BE|nr:TonB-dependent receptor [Sphingobium sp. SCG-1]AUW59371.1 TonB-dependent receptor [Sphingobium sp. SCG-1]
MIFNSSRLQHFGVRRALLAGVALTAINFPQTTLAQPLAPVDASAEIAADDAGAEIIVTARRRDESAQDVPIALSVVGAEQLAATGNFSLGQTQQLVPSLQIFSYNPRNTNINIRGLGSNVSLTNDGLENGVGVYVDNVHYGRVGQSQFDLVDLQQIEILRGPQGTLFGKNTTAGAINITSRAPSFETEFSGEASVGDYGYHQVRGSLSGPIIADKLAARISIADTHRDGFIDNVRTGKKASDYDNFSVRGQLLAKPTDTLSVKLIGDFSKQTLNCCVNLLVGSYSQYDNGAALPNTFEQRVARAGYTPLPFDSFARKTDANSHYQANMRGYGASGQVDWDLGSAALTSITAYRWWDWDPANDSDALGLSVLTKAQQANRQRQFSQELRVASTGERAIDYVAGLYYFWQTIRGYGATEFGADAPLYNVPAVAANVRNAAIAGYGVESYSEPTTKSYAAFGQLTWNASDALKVTAGLRYTYEKKKGVFEQHVASGADLSTLSPAEQATAQALRNQFGPVTSFTTAFDDANVSGLINLSYKVTPDALVYATYSRGGKSGGLNLSVIPVGVNPNVKPETVNHFELGAKTQFLDKKATFNVAGYWTEVTDYQTAITEQVANTVSYRQYIANAGKVRSRGVEADLSYAPTELISFSASGAYVDATYRDYRNAQQGVENLNLGSLQDLSGERLSGVPKFTWTLGADVAQPLGQWDSRGIEVYAHADFSHRSSIYTAVSNSRYSLAPGYGLLNARIGLRSEDRLWDVSVWARNLTDENYFVTLSPANTGLITGQIGDPRTIGVTLRTQL